MKQIIISIFFLTLTVSTRAQISEQWFTSNLNKTPYQLGMKWNVSDLKVDETITFDIFGTQGRMIPHYNRAQETDSIKFLFEKEIKDTLISSINKFVVREYTSKPTKLNTYYTKSNFLIAVLYTDDLGFYVALTNSDELPSNNQNKIKYLKELLDYSLQLMNEEDYGQVAKIKDLRNKIYDLRLKEDVYSIETEQERVMLNEIMKFYSNLDRVTRFEHFLRRYEDEVREFSKEVNTLYN